MRWGSCRREEEEEEELGVVVVVGGEEGPSRGRKGGKEVIGEKNEGGE